MSSDGDGKKSLVVGSLAAARGEVKKPRATAEDAPTMRSVAITTAPSVGFGGVRGHDFGMLGLPPKGLGPPVSLKGGRSQGGLSVKQEWKGEVALPTCWQVKTEALKMASFPLERTHREIPGAEAEEVCSRISEALRVLSIEAEYDDQKAKAKCRTGDYACFRIRLYAGSEEGQPVIVELQRRSGSGMSFMQSCRAILCAAEGKMITPETSKKMPPFMKSPVCNMKCLQGLKPTEVDREAEVANAFNKVVELLNKDQHDSSVLAMEHLCILTDPLKTFPETAVKAAKIIVVSDNDKYNIREDMTALLERDAVPADFDHVDIGQNHADRLRHLALLVFSNALALIAKDGSLERAIQKEQWFDEFLIPTLMDQVQSARTSPNNASIATCCLNSLMSCSTVARGLVHEYDGLQIIAQAHEHGAQCHELLANETSRCMKALEAPQ